MTLKSRITVGIRLISLAGLVGSIFYFLHIFLKTGWGVKQGTKEGVVFMEGILAPYLLVRPSGFIIVWLLLFVLSGHLATLICRRVE